MKMNVNYSEDEVTTLGVQNSKEFGFSKEAEEMIFAMFTKNIYSNPIGSVVREITSNCFDSHKEAGVKDAVVLKLTKENADYYISFIDKGVGMSPERINNVYALYFNSTKRNDNNQIGGFGIGGKTPLAYAESFFLITNHDGIKYTYSIRKGQKSPVLDLLDEDFTDEPNGTTVKIPVKQSDLSSFEREIVRQLYYFENVVFEGFSTYVKNNYKIIEGKHFLYRGNDYNSSMHICLGRVAYPIDFNVFHDDDFDSYSWDVPVAIKLEIGEIGVGASRESIEYNEATKKLIKKKMELVKEELITMLQKQHEKLNSLEEYYALLDNHNALTLKGQTVLNLSSLTRKSRYEKPEFKRMNAIDIPSQAEVVHMFYDVSMLGKKGRRERTWDKALKSIANESVYFVKEGEEMPRKKNAYMKHTFKHFYAIKRSNLTISETKALIKKITPEKSITPSKVIFAQFRELQKDIYKLVEGTTKKYASITVPEGFTVSQSKYDPNYELPLAHVGRYGWDRNRYKLADLENTNATFYYATSDDDQMLKEYNDLLEKVFPSMKATRKCAIGNRYEGMPVNFVLIAKGNVKYVEEFKNFKPLREAVKMFQRKRQAVLYNVEMNKFFEAFGELNSLFLNEKIFANFDAAYAKTVGELKKIRDQYKKVPKLSVYVGEHSTAARVFGIDVTKVTFKGEKLMKVVEAKTAKNGMLKYVSVNNDFDPKNNYYSKEEISNIMQLFKLAYVK